MRKFNLLILTVILLYLVLALGSAAMISQNYDHTGSEYKVEINRLLAQIQADSDSSDLRFTTPDLSSYTYIKNVTFLSFNELHSNVLTDDDLHQDSSGTSSDTDSFFAPANGREYQIEPLYLNGTSAGYLRFDYVLTRDSSGLLLHTELILALMEAILLAVLFYLRQNIIRPFTRFSHIPGELAKGHLSSEIEENKSRFFGHFIWGIGLLKDQLAADRRKELKLQKEKKMMLLSISHDIKTPLNNIKLYARALEEGLYETAAECQHAAHQIGEKTIEIEQFVSEIVKNSSDDILDIQVKNSDFYLSDLIKMVQDTYQNKCELLHLSFQIGSYENKLLKGDLDRSFEVIENIVENALKYGDGQTIILSFYEEDYCQLIRIHNTGTPVTSQEFNHLFDSFFRGSNVGSKDGSGLGLYICRDIMRQMNGEIFAETTSDGMDFVLVFPE